MGKFKTEYINWSNMSLYSLNVVMVITGRYLQQSGQG